MNKIIFVSLIYFLFISEINSISCVSCSNQISSFCDDSSFNASAFVPITNQQYCQKTVSVGGIIIRSGGCLTSSVNGIPSIYCCSDRDLCNQGNFISALIYPFILQFGFFFFH